MRMHPVIGLLAIGIGLAAESALAHPGHVHADGPVHGFSWIDFAGFLLVSLILPAAAWLAVRSRSRRRR